MTKKRRAVKDPRERVLATLAADPATGCWNWQRPLTWGGYGQMELNGSRMNAHRAAWFIFRWPVDRTLDIDHLCRNRACVNPDHLEPVTRAENLRRGEVGGVHQRTLTHCPAGHPYDEANTYRPPGRNGRQCRACMRVARLSYYHRTKTTKGSAA